MRILYIIQFFGLKDESGSSRAYTTARGWVEQGHQVTVLCGDVHYLTEQKHGQQTNRRRVTEEIHDGIRVVRVPMARDFRRNLFRRLVGYLSFAWYALLAGLKLGKHDIVLTSIQPIFVGPVGWIISRSMSAKFVLEVRDVWPDVLVFFNILKNRLVLVPLWLMERTLYCLAKHIICLTPGILRNLRAKAVPASKLSMLPTGVETELFADTGKDRQQVRDRHGWGEKTIAIYTGGMARTDSLITILEAAEILAGRTDIHFVMMGEGDRKPALQEWARQKKLPNLEFLPIQTRDILRNYLNAADMGLIGIFDNPYADLCLQNKFFDYLGAGLPTVGALRGDQENAITFANAGIVVPPGDSRRLAEAIASLADNSVKRQKMGANAKRAGTEYFARGPIVTAYEEILSKVYHDQPVAPAVSTRWPMFDWKVRGWR